MVTVIGDVDLASLPRLAATLEDLGTGEPAATAPGPGRPESDAARTAVRIVDLRSVDWFDPMCLGVLLSADLRARRQGASLVVRATGAVAGLLEETRLDSVLEIES